MVAPRSWQSRVHHEVGGHAALDPVCGSQALVGEAGAVPIGFYCYDKRRRQGTVPCRVEVFLLDVADELERWPEWHQRRRSWFTPQDASALVAEAKLKSLILEAPQIAATTGTRTI